VAKIDTVSDKSPMSAKSENKELPPLTAGLVRDWIQNVATGEFHFKEVLGGRVLKEGYEKLRKILWDLCHENNPIVESIGKHDGHYRPIQELPQPIDFQTTPLEQRFKLKLPFELETYIWIYPETVGAWGGSKSADKTGLIMETVLMNMYDVNTILLSNLEGGTNQMNDRFIALAQAMGIDLPYPRPFQAYPVFENFHDMIKEKDTLYLIDYISVPDSGEFFLIAPQIAKVRRKLVGKNSVAIIALQKPFGRKLPFGKDDALKDLTFYVTLDSERGNSKKLEIYDAKKWVDPLVNPVGLTFNFSIDHSAGGKIVDIERGGYADEEN